ncbi:MAG TPA: alpha-ketoacid dehydrogenase subunit beta [Chloroflexota bacterium]
MREINFADATLEALQEEMRRDPGVFVMGEDIARQGGIFGQFKGLTAEFGADRVLDTPISEAAIVGAALGAAMTGMRPVVDIHFADFITCAMDEMVNQISKVRYMSGGQATAPLVIRAPDGIARQVAAQHSQSLEAWFFHAPGMKIVVPSNPADAKGLLKSAIREDNPVLYCEHKSLYIVKGPVPEGEHVVPLGRAALRREGRHVTVLSYSITVNKALEAARQLSEEGIEVEVVDLRSLVPMDMETISESARKTHRVLVAHEAVRRGGVGAEIAATLGEILYDDLDAPVMRVGAKEVPVPFSAPMERFVIPQVDDLKAAIKQLMVGVPL